MKAILSTRPPGDRPGSVLDSSLSDTDSIFTLLYRHLPCTKPTPSVGSQAGAAGSVSVAVVLVNTRGRVVAQKWTLTPVLRDAAKTTKLEASPSELGLHLDETAPNLSLRDTGLPCLEISKV